MLQRWHLTPANWMTMIFKHWHSKRLSIMCVWIMLSLLETTLVWWSCDIHLLSTGKTIGMLMLTTLSASMQPAPVDSIFHFVILSPRK